MVRIGRTILLALAVGGLPAFARAQAPAEETVAFHGLTFPASIAGAERFSVREYEKDNPGLGYSVGYRQPGAVSTVYIYDLKARSIPDDPSAPAIKAEFEAAKADMIAAQQQGFEGRAEGTVLDRGCVRPQSPALHRRHGGPQGPARRARDLPVRRRLE